MRKRIAAILLTLAALIGFAASPASALTGHRPALTAPRCSWYSDGYMDSTNHITYQVGAHAATFHDGYDATCPTPYRHVTNVRVIWNDTKNGILYPMTKNNVSGGLIPFDMPLPIGGATMIHYDVHLDELQYMGTHNGCDIYVWMTVARLNVDTYRTGS